MAVLYSAATNTTWDGVSSVTFSHTTAGTNRGLIVSAAWYDGGASLITSITYAGVAMTQVASRLSEYNLGVEMRKLSNPALGANNVVITFDDAAGAGAAGATSFTGAFQTTAGMTGTADSTVANAATINLKIASNNTELVVDAFGSNATATVGAGQVQMFNRSDPYANICAASYETGTNSVVMSWTLLAGADAYAGIAAAIKSAAGLEYSITSGAGVINVLSYTPSAIKMADAKPSRGLIVINSDEQHVDPVYVDPSRGLLKITGYQQAVDVAAPGYTPETGLFSFSGKIQNVGLHRNTTPDNGLISTNGFIPVLIGGMDTYPAIGAIVTVSPGEIWVETAPWLRDRDRATDGWTAQTETPATWAAQADATGFWTEVKSLKDV